MIKYQMIEGLPASPGAASFPLRPEDEALGAIPGWVAYLDPDFCSLADNTILQRAQPNAELTFASGSFDLGSFPNGETAFSISGATRTRLPGEIDPAEWTVFAVMMPQTSPSAAHIAATSVESPTDLALRIGTDTAARMFNVYEHSDLATGSVYRARYDSNASPRGRLANRLEPSLLLVTFSTAQGISIRDGGVEVATNPTDRRPLTHGFRSGDWEMLRGSRGLRGCMGVLNTDLSRPEAVGWLANLEAFLMDKYGIPS